MISRLVRLRAWGSEDNEIVILVSIRVGLKPRLHNINYTVPEIVHVNQIIKNIFDIIEEEGR